MHTHQRLSEVGGTLSRLLGHHLPALTAAALLTAGAAFGKEPSPSVLIVDFGPGENTQTRVDFNWLRRMHEQDGIQFDVHYHGNRPLTWDRVKPYHVLLILQFPTTCELAATHIPTQATDVCPRTAEVLDRYLDEGGGVFLMPDLAAAIHGKHAYSPRTRRRYLDRWGIKICHDLIVDEASSALHPKYGGFAGSQAQFIYTDAVSESPVSAGVAGIWFPVIPRKTTIFGHPVRPVDEAWQVVVRGRDTSRTRPVTSGDDFARSAAGFAHEREIETFKQERFFSPDNATPPALFAIRAAGNGRLAITVMNPIYHIRYGSSWVHDGVVLDKGLNGVPSDFGRLFVNTVKWLAEPSRVTARLGGYVQQPDVITHPHFRRSPQEFYPEFDSYQNPVPPAVEVYRGIIGARSAYSTGEGTVEEWADAARRAGLGFLVFLEEFGALSEDDFRKLEAECRRLSGDDLALLPGFALRDNVGNHAWCHGFDIAWPSDRVIDDQGRLAIQDVDDQGLLLYDNKAATHWRYQFLARSESKNFGYFNFGHSDPGHVPVRNLRIYGMLGVVAYLHGQRVEDVTDAYFNLLPQGNVPKIGAVSILTSPAQMLAFLAERPTLTHVAAHRVQDIPGRLQYGHQYGQPNVNLSSGPRIHAWAGMHRVLTYAGESFVTGRCRVPVLAKVTSDVGLDEIRIYRDAAGEGARLFRRIRLDGGNEYEQVFEWGYDRQGAFVLEAIDRDGGRALSAAFEMAHDGNWHHWCHDRHNGELWHGPFAIRGTWATGWRSQRSVGFTWDGGAIEPFQGLNLRIDCPHLLELDERGERIGDHRRMEGHTFITCIDDTVRNIGGEAGNVYAPGVVANSYHTYGPILPSDRMRLRVRRTEYMARIEGPLRDWHAMWAERSGGALALHEGAVTLLRDMTLGGLNNIGHMSLISFFEPNRPLWVIRENAVDDSVVFETPDLPWSVTLQPGGYIAVFGTELGTPSMVVNVGQDPVAAHLRGHPRIHFAEVENRRVRAGERLDWRLLYLYDGPDHEARTAERADAVWRYFGLDGKGGTHGLDVKRGRRVSTTGLVDIEAEKGVVEFTVPEPEMDPALDMPLGVRFFGFNRNWTVGLLQVAGYTPGYYNEDGCNLYRNLGVDDQDTAFLAVYTKGVPLSHMIAGHPVTADDPDLRINVTKLAAAPDRWRLDVNNATDRVIQTTVRVNMPEVGIPLQAVDVELAPGAYQTLLRPSADLPPARP